MPRPRKCRMVCCLPQINEFSPLEPMEHNPIVMSVDEYETIRLIDYVGLSQEECAASMEIARTTAQQIYTVARQKIAHALVDGVALRIEGGDYHLYHGEGDHCGCGGECHHRRCAHHHGTCDEHGTPSNMA